MTEKEEKEKEEEKQHKEETVLVRQKRKGIKINSEIAEEKN